MPSQKDVTRLLLEWSHGDKDALDELMPLVYDELRRLVSRHLRQVQFRKIGHSVVGPRQPRRGELFLALDGPTVPAP